MGVWSRQRRAALLFAMGVALATSHPAVASVITFDPAQTSSGNVILIGGGSSDPGQSIDLRTLPSTAPLPRRITIEVPAGYHIDLGAAPGTAVAEAAISLLGSDSNSFATGYDDLLAENPLTYAADPAAQACAPGTHAAVWHASLAVATQKVDVTIFVDPGGADGAAYTLQACPSGLSPGTSRIVTDLSLLGLVPLTAPTAPGGYLWHAFLTPDDGQTYELQSLVPLPEFATLHATYDRKGRVAHLTGRVVEGGKPAGGVSLFVDSPSRNPLLLEGKTKADGTFSFRTTLKRTTQLELNVSQSVDACAGTSSAPGGCLSRISVPPDDAYATVWVSPRGGAVRATRAADQRTAEREDVTLADLPAGFVNEGLTDAGLGCENPTHESDLTITGESSSPSFLALAGTDDEPSIALVRSHVRIFRTAREAQEAWRREAVPKTARCELDGLAGGKTKIKAVRFAVAGRARAFRAVVPVSDRASAHADSVFLLRGRSLAVVSFVGAGQRSAVEGPLLRRVAGRLH